MASQTVDRERRAGAVRLVLRSLANFADLVGRGELHLAEQRLGLSFRLLDGRFYRVFRDSYRTQPAQSPTVIEVVFRLKLIGAARVPHWAFQRLCVLTTPFWSGFDGFVVKLWMVHPQTKGYAGIYQWAGVGAAQRYLDVLLPVLRVVSVPGSVRYRLHPETELADFLRERSERSEPPADRGAVAAQRRAA